MEIDNGHEIAALVSEGVHHPVVNQLLEQLSRGAVVSHPALLLANHGAEFLAQARECLLADDPTITLPYHSRTESNRINGYAGHTLRVAYQDSDRNFALEPIKPYGWSIPGVGQIKDRFELQARDVILEALDGAELDWQALGVDTSVALLNPLRMYANHSSDLGAWFPLVIAHKPQKEPTQYDVKLIWPPNDYRIFKHLWVRGYFDSKTLLEVFPDTTLQGRQANVSRFLGRMHSNFGGDILNLGYEAGTSGGYVLGIGNVNAARNRYISDLIKDLELDQNGNFQEYHYELNHANFDWVRLRIYDFTRLKSVNPAAWPISNFDRATGDNDTMFIEQTASIQNFEVTFGFEISRDQYEHFYALFDSRGLLGINGHDTDAIVRARDRIKENMHISGYTWFPGTGILTNGRAETLMNIPFFYPDSGLFDLRLAQYRYAPIPTQTPAQVPNTQLLLAINSQDLSIARLLHRGEMVGD